MACRPPAGGAITHLARLIATRIRRALEEGRRNEVVYHVGRPGNEGYVERVLDGPSCDLLEVGEDGILVPLVSDAVKRVDLEARVIEIDREFLGL